MIYKPKSNERFWYLAYGANLDLAGMHVRCPNAERFAAGYVQDWRLVFRGVADIEPCRNATVPVALWIITADCLKALNRFEGHPHLYRHEILSVHVGARTIKALAYVMNSDGYSPPSRGYLDCIRRGYTHWDLPVETLEKAAAHAESYCLKRGAIGFVSQGPKRMRPVYPAPEPNLGIWDEPEDFDWDDAEDEPLCPCLSPGASPATVASMRLECGCGHD